MRKDIALKRYLQRHIEPGLPDAPPGLGLWQHVLVIPAYDESPDLLQALKVLDGAGKILVILVLNRPDSNPDVTCNSALRADISLLKKHTQASGLALHHLGNSLDLLCLDLETISGPNPAAQGVGLARKTGCDVALLWQAQGAISSEWICCSDADALLPPDYFSRLGRAESSVAAVFPFVHSPASADDINRATALYELRLHQYVLGLSYAKSPYAHHTLGSCIAVRRRHYAQVRGYPKRAGGEDFYLLNKLTKLGSIASLDGQCISIASRRSHRVPFGTGPAIEKIIAGEETNIFYHPACFDALRAVIAAAPQLGNCGMDGLAELLESTGAGPELAQVSSGCLNKLGISQAIAHCLQHGKTEQQFLRQFHQWFDGFRTLKFIHAIRDSGRPMLTLEKLIDFKTGWFPTTEPNEGDLEALLAAIRNNFGWTIQLPGFSNN